MQFYFVSYRKDAFLIAQIDALSVRVTALENPQPPPEEGDPV